MTLIIGLLGAAGSGKTTVAKYLVEKYGAKQYTLAAPLKKLVGAAFDLTEEQLYGSQDAKETVDPRYNVSPRWLLQRIGTQGFRGTFGENFWINYALDRIFEEDHPVVVIDDCRFKNETRAILNEYNANVWKLYCTKKWSNADSTHQSEAEWNLAAYTDTITHDGENLEALYKQVDDLYGRITRNR